MKLVLSVGKDKDYRIEVDVIILEVIIGILVFYHYFSHIAYNIVLLQWQKYIKKSPHNKYTSYVRMCFGLIYLYIFAPKNLSRSGLYVHE